MDLVHLVDWENSMIDHNSPSKQNEKRMGKEEEGREGRRGRERKNKKENVLN